MNKTISKVAGELSILFKTKDRSYPQWKMQNDIDAILIRNGIKQEQEDRWWEK